MRTDGELRLVPDAALPDLEAELDERPVDEAVRLERQPVSPESAEMLQQAAVRAAERHLERLRRRRRRFPQRFQWSGADVGLRAARYCVIDLETTGGAGGSEILEVGAVRVVDGELGLELGALVHPQGEISAAAFVVHGITLEAVVTAPRIEAVLPVLLEMGRDCVLVFHNAGFDLGFLQRALRAADRDPFDAVVVDTLVVARQLVGGRCGLGTVAARLGVPGPHPHRALADARLTAKLWVAFVDVLCAAGALELADVPGVRRTPTLP